MASSAPGSLSSLRALPVRSGRRSRTRDRICEAARAMFLANGFATATMEQIAQAAEIGRSTLYTHFRDKDEILTAIVEDYLTKVTPLIASLESPSPDRAEIDRWIGTFAAFVSREQASSLLLIQSTFGKGVPPAVRDFSDQIMRLYAERLPPFAAALSPTNVVAWARASAALRELSWALIHHVEEGGSPRAAAMLDLAGDLFEWLIHGWKRREDCG